MAHRVEHAFIGSGVLCLECELPASNHRIRFSKKVDTRSRWGRRQEREKRDSLIMGIDGEGQGREHHRYVLLAASDASGEHQYYVENHDGLHTEECLDFIVSLPEKARLFAYAFNYDLTKILEDVDNKTLYELFRPELRQRSGLEASKGPWPVVWGDWVLNMQGTKFSVARKRGGRARLIWDIWKFYQSKFVNALDDWKVGTDEERRFIRYMKDHRAEFDQQSHDEVRRYCFHECQFMAQLTGKLVAAHQSAGLKLTDFYGAGSSAKAMLKKMGVRDHIEPAPEEMTHAVASAFFGGRFENSVIGPVEKPVYSYDISSAYPYQLCFLPCLAHGVWEHTDDDDCLTSGNAALVHYRVSGTTKSVSESWAPLPYRTPTGSICFPAESGGGWVWRDEFLAAQRLFPNIEFLDAWVYETDCDCTPFKDIPHYYRERCRIGKEGPGIVLKLGCNSCYGKLAQSVGKGQFNSWIWAGMITSGCRAQILHALGCHNDWSKMLMVATDGIHSLEKLNLPQPLDTGTWEAYVTEKDGTRVAKPLGGWEMKVIKQGVFYARPGVYFPMRPSDDDLKAVRGRGVGRGAVLDNWKRIVDCWAQQYPRGENGWPETTVANVSRFCGAKSSISVSVDKVSGTTNYNRAEGWHTHPYKPEPRYGEWVNREVRINFNPLPKREFLVNGNHLTLRDMPLHVESKPYKKALRSAEAEALALNQLHLSEQPDGDFVVY